MDFVNWEWDGISWPEAETTWLIRGKIQKWIGFWSLLLSPVEDLGFSGYRRVVGRYTYMRITRCGKVITYTYTTYICTICFQESVDKYMRVVEYRINCQYLGPGKSFWNWKGHNIWADNWSCFWSPMLVRSFASLESSQAVVSEDKASTVSVRGSRSGW